MRCHQDDFDSNSWCGENVYDAPPVEYRQGARWKDQFAEPQSPAAARGFTLIELITVDRAGGDPRGDRCAQSLRGDYP